MILSADINNEYFHIFEYYFQKFDALYVNPKIFIQFSLVITVLYITRLIMFLSMENSKGYDNNKLKVIRVYIFRHLGMEFLIGYIICYCIINMTNAGIDNYIINSIIAPALGFVASIILDIKCIMPLEKNMGDIGLPNMGFVPKKEEPKSIPTTTTPSSNNITVNVNTNSGSNTEDCGCKKDKSTSSVAKLSYDVITSEDYNKLIIDTINNLIDNQNKRCSDMSSLVDKINDKISDIEKKLVQYVEDIDKIKKAELDELKPILKKDIYDSLNKGFVLPADNDRITAEYLTYINLGGNHEVKFLFENHYLKLGVHEDRRKNSISVDNDRRNTNPIKYEYGCFDNEYLEEGDAE